MATSHDFSYGHYLEALDDAKTQGYKVTGFAEAERDLGARVIVLRHDIDISLESAVSLAKLEGQRRIKATYLPMMHAPFYSLLGDTEDSIAKILSYGHDLGYHFDSDFLKAFPSPGQGLATEIAFVEALFATKVRAFSQHNPSVQGMTRIRPPGYVDAYAAKETLGLKYVSDSVQNWREGCFCTHIGRQDRLQVLTHPEWWTREGMERSKILVRLESKETSAVRARYRWLEGLHTSYLESVKRPAEKQSTSRKGRARRHEG